MYNCSRVPGSQPGSRRYSRASLLLATLTLLAACGGNTGDAGAASISPPGSTTSATSGSSSYTVPAKPQSEAEAARFLAQATFGPTAADIKYLMDIGYSAWLDEQFAMSRGRSYMQWQETDSFSSNRSTRNGTESSPMASAWFTKATLEKDQLRQRMTWALSQILVVSGQEARISLSPQYFLPTYADLLADNSFQNYRTLMERVTLNPLMGLMLSHIDNRDTAQTPADQNYAREVMQLFSIGLWQLNQDGSFKLDSSGNRIPTYGNDDVVGLSRVFTGWTMDTSSASTACSIRSSNSAEYFRCQMAPTGRHSLREKKFLGVTIPAVVLDPNVVQNVDIERRAQQEAPKDLKVALDTLFEHPNVGPFLARQLIQRFVTSNPSPAYVKRVAERFENNGSGVRGDLKAVLRQILLDPEARDPAMLQRAEWGKVREPLLASVAMMRALKASDGKGNVWGGSYNCWSVHRMATQPLESPFYAPSVFNFYRPGFTPASGKAQAAGMVAPEMQITDTFGVQWWAQYVNSALLREGTGHTGQRDDAARGCGLANRFDYSEFWAYTDDPAKLVDQVSLIFLPGAQSTALRDGMIRAVQSVQGTTDQNRRDRLRIALTMALLSPEFRVQR